MNVLGDLRYVDAGEFAAVRRRGGRRASARRQRDEFLARQAGAHRSGFRTAVPAGLLRRSGGCSGPQGTYGQWLLGAARGDPHQRHGVHARRPVVAAARAQPGAAEPRLPRGRCTNTSRPSPRCRGGPAAVRGRVRAPPRGRHRRGSRPCRRAQKRGAGAAPSSASGGGRRPAARTAPAPTGTGARPSATSAPKPTCCVPFLRQVGARRVVIGHTVARNATVVSRFDGAVVKLDAGMNRAVYQGRPAALVSEAPGSRVAYALPDVAARGRSGGAAVPQFPDDRRGRRRRHPRARHDRDHA